MKSPLDDVLVPGHKLAGKYLVMSKLGVGNFAYVVRGKHEAMDRDVALKLLKPEVVAAHPDVSDRFLTEVRIVSRLRSPNTVTIYDFGETAGGLLYMVLEFVDGVTLEQVIKRGAFELPRALKICLQVLKSLDEAHTQEVVHRDLKPGNIMLTNTHGSPDFVKVLDFGVAKLVTEDDKPKVAARRAENVRRSTQFIGTPIYMSPEQVLGREVSASSDLYSLGLMLYQMITGCSPMDSKLTVAAVAQLHIDPEPLPFENFDQIPMYLQRVIRKATDRDPAKRYQTAREFARALRLDASGQFEKAVRPNTPTEDVFKGRSYVDIPAEGLEAPRPKAAPVKHPGAGMLPKRPKSTLGSAGSLEVDLAHVKQAKLERKRSVQKETKRAERKGGDKPAEMGWAVGSILLSIAVFFVGSAVVTGSPGFRIVGGLTPAAAGLLMTSFSNIRPLQGHKGHRWFRPYLRNLALISASLIVVLSLLGAHESALSLRASYDWFSESLGPVGPILAPIAKLACAPVAWWFDLMASILS